MPLPDEELAQIRAAGAGVVIERRGSRRDGGQPTVPAALLTPLALERPAGDLTRVTPGPARFAPLARTAVRALEPAFGAARVVSERLHRQRDDAASLLAEARVLEEAGAGEAAFFAYGRALLAAPLDASAVRPLERLAAAHHRQLELAELYESVIAAVASHPSAATLERRATQLRALAASPSAAAAEPEPARSASRKSGAAAPDPAPPASQPSVAATPDPARPGSLSFADAGTPDPTLSASRSSTAAASADGQAPPGSSPPIIPEAPAMAAAPGAASGPRDDTDAAFTMVQPTSAFVGHGDGREAAVDAETDRSFGARQVPLFSAPEDPETVTTAARLLAWAVDGVLLAAIPFASIAAASAAFARPGLSWLDSLQQAVTQSASLTGAALLLALLVAFVYLTLGLAIGGRTLGDRVAGLRSVDAAHGGPPDLATAALRSALAIAGTLAFLAGPLWALVDADGRSLHDKVAGTRTVRC